MGRDEGVFEMINPGCIISNGSVIGRDAHNRGWVVEFQYNSSTHHALLKDRHIPKGMPINSGSCINNLVVIGKGSILYHVAIDSYIDALKEYYYKINVKCAIRNRQIWRSFYKRWETDCALSFKHHFAVEATNLSAGNLLKIYKLSKKGDYILPVLGYTDIEKLKGQRLFYPQPISSNVPLPRAVYRPDELNGFPHQYKAELNGITVNGMRWNRQVYIFLHGFISPTKWHFDVWKHKYGLTNNPPFDRCRVNRGKDSCYEAHCVREGLFEKIHQEKVDSFTEYISNIVTFFKNDTTNKIEIYSVPDSDYYKEIRAGFLMEINNENQFLLLYGKCFNWIDNEPVFHLTPVTLFPRKRLILNVDTRNWILIYEGELKDIQKC